MHRTPLLQQLESYHVKFPDEAKTIERLRNFIETNADCFERSLSIGHITGSAWLVDATKTKVLLTHHKKLNRWLQLGGHADGDSNVLRVALKEAHEESGLPHIEALSSEIFDIDIHSIPARKTDPKHLHYDIRYALRYAGDSKYKVSEESHDLAWIEIERLEEVTTEESMLRMARKHLSQSLI